jgi:hypothetical protein
MLLKEKPPARAAIENTRPNYTANLNNQVSSYQSVIAQETGQ